VPFWSPTFSVTEDRLTELDGDADADAGAEAEVDDAADEELELLDEEQAATPRPVTAITENARSFRLWLNVIPSISMDFNGNGR
jgi:hypothetical protein